MSRTYRYYVSTQPVVPPFWKGYCWDLLGEVDVPLLGEAAALTVGRHDFIAFTPAETEHVFFERTVLGCRWRRTATDLAGAPGGRSAAPGVDTQAVRSGGGRGMLYLEIEADAFLRHMVRTLVGTMVEVAQGKRELADFARLLEGGRRETAGPTAPARGLFLWDVKYRRRQAGAAATAPGGARDATGAAGRTEVATP